MGNDTQKELIEQCEATLQKYKLSEEHHMKIVKELSSPIDESKLKNINRIGLLVSKYLTLYQELMYMSIKTNKYLEKLKMRELINIKAGTHKYANLTLSTTEQMALAKSSDSYIDIDALQEELILAANTIQKQSKIISDYSFHYKTTLDYERFLAGM